VEYEEGMGPGGAMGKGEGVCPGRAACGARGGGQLWRERRRARPSGEAGSQRCACRGVQYREDRVACGPCLEDVGRWLWASPIL
jgi:hypothetical protein